MKNIVYLLVLLSLSGCAAGSATAGYAMKAGTCDDLKSETRKSIITDAVEQCFDKCKTYIDAKNSN